MQPQTQYVRSGDVSIAYQVVGDGPHDVVFVPGFVSHVEQCWDIPSVGPLLRQLASVSRLIVFDKRGTGMSDRISGAPSLETRMDDVRAVLDAVGSSRAAIVGLSEGVPMSILFAATYPPRTTGLVLIGGFARSLWAPDYPWGDSEAQYHEDAAELVHLLFEDPEGAVPYWMEWIGCDEEQARLLIDYCRRGGSPGAVQALGQMNKDIDVRDVLPSIRVPTLFVHGEDDPGCPVGAAEYMARRVPGSRMEVLRGTRHLPFGESLDRAVSEIERFLGLVWEQRAWEEVDAERVLATVLVTDIVSSSERATELGDRSWRELLERHHAIVRAQLTRFRGTEVDTAGDGFLARFDGPARAVRCGSAIVSDLRKLGLDVRVGLHTGECELLGEKVAGIAVHTGARVAAQASPGEVLVSSTVKDLVAGSGIRFEERGRHALKGIPGEWNLYAFAGETPS